MRVYQPVLTDDLGVVIKGNKKVYRYLKNARKDYPGESIQVFDIQSYEDYNFADIQETRIRIIHDSSPINPFENDEGLYPTMSDNSDFSEGDIDRYLGSFTTSYEFLVDNKEAIFDLIERSQDEFNEDYPLEDFTEDERIDYLMEELEEFVFDSLKHRAYFCSEFGIKHYFGVSKGYSQGDWAEVFVCWTPEFEKITGMTYEKSTEDFMKGSFDMYTMWAWGDVYGYSVEDAVTGEDIDSCWGFYGTDWANNGLLESVMECIEDKTEEEVKNILDDLDLEYSI